VCSSDLSELGEYGGEALVSASPSGKAITWTVALAPAQTTQTSRPTADISVSGVVGVPAPGPGEGIHSPLAASTDSEYAQFSDGGSARVAMAPPADPPPPSGITVKYRGCFAGGASGGEFDFILKEGHTTIATWTEQLTDGFADGSYTREPGEAAAVTDWSDLNITATASLD